MLDLWYWYGGERKDRWRRPHRRWRRRPSTGEGVDRLKMSVIQAAMLWQQQQLFSNKKKQLELELDTIVKGSKVGGGSKTPDLVSTQVTSRTQRIQLCCVYAVRLQEQATTAAALE